MPIFRSILHLLKRCSIFFFVLLFCWKSNVKNLNWIFSDVFFPFYFLKVNFMHHNDFYWDWFQVGRFSVFFFSVVLLQWGFSFSVKREKKTKISFWKYHKESQISGKTGKHPRLAVALKWKINVLKLERFYCIVDGKPYMSHKIHPEYNTNDKWSTVYNQPGIKNVASHKMVECGGFSTARRRIS